MSDSDAAVYLRMCVAGIPSTKAIPLFHCVLFLFIARHLSCEGDTFVETHSCQMRVTLGLFGAARDDVSKEGTCALPAFRDGLDGLLPERGGPDSGIIGPFCSCFFLRFVIIRAMRLL